MEVEQTEPFLKARFVPYPLPEDSGTEVEALQRAVIDLALKVLELAEVQTPITVQQLAAQAQDPLRFAFLLGSMLSLETSKEQALLEAPTRHEALRLLHDYLEHEVQVPVFEVAHAAVDQPRRPARRPRREVALLDERDREPSARGVPGDAGAGDPPTDHEQVERPVAEGGEADHQDPAGQHDLHNSR